MVHREWEETQIWDSCIFKKASLQDKIANELLVLKQELSLIMAKSGEGLRENTIYLNFITL